MNYKEVKKLLRNQIAYSYEGEAMSKESIERRMQSIINQWKSDGTLDPKVIDIEQLTKDIQADLLGLGPLQFLLDDPDITEVMVNGIQSIYIEKAGKKQLTNVQFDDEQHLRYVIERMLMPTRRRVDETYPYVDFSLEDGSRVNIIIPPVVFGAPVMTIRKFLRNIATVENLVNKMGTMNPAMAELLIAAIKARLNIVFSGATGSGKTTLLEILSSYVSEDDRIITIEDTLELTLRQNHVVRLITKPPNVEGKGEISIRDLFINTLRMRPTRIILGEIRGKEALDFLQALNSGHRGSLAVLHASSPEDVIGRIETMALFADIGLPSWALRKQIARAIDLIIQLEQMPGGVRKVTHITEVIETKEDMQLKDIFVFHEEGLDDNGKMKGHWEATGYVPECLEEFRKRGVPLSEDIFKR